VWHTKDMENQTAMTQTKITELEALLRLLTATGASAKRLAVLRAEIEALRSAA
jgi:hypothetical protein